MKQHLPPVDDTRIWDTWLSMYKVPSISVALELDIFESLDAEPDSAEGLAARRDFDLRGLNALLPMLLRQGYLRLHEGRYQLTLLARHYMLKASPWFWGPLYARIARTVKAHELLLETVSGQRALAEKTRPADGWESGHIDVAMAKEVTGFMHSHSIAAAVGMTWTCDFSELDRVLDIGGGSGCFSIALAQQRANVRCTVMELPTIAALAKRYIAEAGLSDRVDTVVVDMFRQDWPAGYDTHFFSNIFHDWSFDTCRELARRSFAALESGGRILLHEMLLDDDGLGPEPAVIFSLLMAMGTKGQQFTFGQLRDILESAGFRDVRCEHSYGYYSIVRGDKP